MRRLASFSVALSLWLLPTFGERIFSQQATCPRKCVHGEWLDRYCDKCSWPERSVKADKPVPGPFPRDPDSFQARLAVLHGNERIKAGADRLGIHPVLEDVAQQQADWLAAHNRMGHQGPGGNWPWDRVKAAGYEFRKCGENMAGDFETPEQAFRGWMMSSGHKKTLLDPEYIDCGFGLGVDARGRKYWVAVFARPK